MTKREVAMLWWNNKSTRSKELIASIYYDRVHHTLTGREIERVYDKIAEL